MAILLPNETELCEKIKSEKITVASRIWDIIYNQVIGDINIIRLICHYFLIKGQSMPFSYTERILFCTSDIGNIINKIRLVIKEKFPFPVLSDTALLHPAIEEMFTHHIANDVYMINLIIEDCDGIDEPKPVSSNALREIVSYTDSIKAFLHKIKEAIAA